MAKKRKSETARPEWQHLIDVREIGKVPVRLSIEAGAAERGALSQRVGVSSIDSLKADLILEREKGGMTLHVTGRLMADVTQKCVITSEPVHSRIEEDFEGWFADPEQAVSFTKVKREKEMEKGPADFPILEEHEDPEPIVDGQIDVGELTAQYLSLAIDPYPQAPGVVYQAAAPAPAGPEAKARRNPFEALKDWKARHSSDKS